MIHLEKSKRWYQRSKSVKILFRKSSLQNYSTSIYRSTRTLWPSTQEHRPRHKKVRKRNFMSCERAAIHNLTFAYGLVYPSQQNVKGCLQQSIGLKWNHTIPLNWPQSKPAIGINLTKFQLPKSPPTFITEGWEGTRGFCVPQATGKTIVPESGLLCQIQQKSWRNGYQEIIVISKEGDQKDQTAVSWERWVKGHRCVGKFWLRYVCNTLCFTTRSTMVTILVTLAVPLSVALVFKTIFWQMAITKVVIQSQTSKTLQEQKECEIYSCHHSSTTKLQPQIQPRPKQTYLWCLQRLEKLKFKQDEVT